MGAKILVIGSSNTDMTVSAKSFPQKGETIIGGSFRMGQGGKGANQAVAAKKLGGDVSFVCKVGRDMFGQNSLAKYREVGLDISRILYSDLPSGVAIITLNENAENTIVVASEANLDFTVEDVESISDLIRQSDILLLQFEIPIASVLHAAKIANEAGVRVIINPAPATEIPNELLRYTSLLIPNECEASTLSGIQINDIETAREASRILRANGAENIIITLGSNGSLLFDTEEHLVPAYKVTAVDTVAAGDTFCGGVCVALSEGKSLYDAVHFATAASAIAVTRSGAQESIPSREEVERLLNGGL